jgi:hypothetical protein
MKKKLLLFLIRVIRFFKAEDTYLPNLRAVPEGQVRYNRMYRYFGRIVVARSWDHPVTFSYKVLTKDGWQQCTQLHYQATLENRGPEYAMAEREGDACAKCCCQQQGLPCRCDFTTGTNTGYYELVHSDTQYSDNISL